MSGEYHTKKSMYFINKYNFLSFYLDDYQLYQLRISSKLCPTTKQNLLFYF
jgi:hypothetical protein